MGGRSVSEKTALWLTGDQMPSLVRVPSSGARGDAPGPALQCAPWTTRLPTRLVGLDHARHGGSKGHRACSHQWSAPSPDLAVRSDARLDLLDAVGVLLSFGGFGLAVVAAASWFWLGPSGFVLMTSGYAVKGDHPLPARRGA